MTLTELLETKDRQEEMIVDYLIKYTAENNWHRIEETQRTIKECMDYIKGEAKKQASNNMAMIEDKVVYSWAVEFFNQAKQAQPTATKNPETIRPRVEERLEKENEQLSLF